MKNILILLLLIPFFGFAQIQDEYYRVSDWTFLPDSVVQLTDTTYSIFAEPANYNDPGSIDRIVGGYVVDFVGHRYVVIDSTDTHLTIFDIYKTGQAPQTGQIAHCYRSVGNGEADFIGSVDYSTLDASARWKINGADNELMWQKVKTKVPYLGAERDVDLGANSISTDTVKIDGVPLLLNTFKKDSLGGAGNIFYSTGASSQPASGSVNQVIGGNALTSGYVPYFNGTNLANTNAYFDGTNVGIGRTFPLAKLHISGTNHVVGAGYNDYGNLFIGTTDGWAVNKGGTLSLGGNYLNGGEYNPILSVSFAKIHGKMETDGSGYLDGYLAFETGNNDLAPYSFERMRITSDGNVGIGTTTPSEALDVNGNAIADVLKSRVPTGTPPLVVASTTKVDNLNVEMLDGKHASDFQLKSDTLTFDATLSDLNDSTAAIRALANTKATISGTDNYIMKKTGDNTLGNSSISEDALYNYFGKPAYFTNGFNVTRMSTADLQNNKTTNSGILTNSGYGMLNKDSTALAYSGWWHVINMHHTDNNGFNAQIIAPLSATDPNLHWRNSASGIWSAWKTLKSDNGADLWGFGTLTPSARIHSQSTGTQLRLGYDANKYTDLSTTSAGTFNISPSGGFTNFSGGISASAFSTFTGQVEMTGLDVNLGASTVLRKNGSDIFTAPITMGACGSAGQVLTSTGLNSAPTWTTPATGSGSGITSIGIQVPTGLTVSPASLTANGTFTIGLQSGYSIPTTANQTNWSTAYSQRLISVSASYPLYLSLTNNVLTGYLHQRLVDFANANQSTGYLYWNGSSYSYQAATTTYTLPTASNSTLGGIQVSSTDGGLAMSGNYLLQKDNVLTARTPVLSDPIAFYDASATAQGQTTFAEIRTIMNGVQTLTSASSITMNFATAPKGSLSLATNSTITITNVPDGGEGSIEVTSSGAYTLAIAGSTGYTSTQKMGTVSAIASSAHTTVFYWRSGTVLYYGFLLNN